jgi:hypothetical protein
MGDNMKSIASLQQRDATALAHIDQLVSSSTSRADEVNAEAVDGRLDIIKRNLCGCIECISTWPYSSVLRNPIQHSPVRAFILVGSRADSESLVVGSEAGVPPFEVLAKPIVDDADAHLQYQVRTLR